MIIVMGQFTFFYLVYFREVCNIAHNRSVDIYSSPKRCISNCYPEFHICVYGVGFYDFGIRNWLRLKNLEDNKVNAGKASRV